MHMPPILIKVFAVLGVLFFLVIIGVLYLVLADPFNVRPLISSFFQAAPTIESVPGFTEVVDDMIMNSETTETSPAPAATGTTPETAIPPSGATGGVVLSEAQKEMLRTLGVDAAQIPNVISAELETCLRTALGANRVDEILAGEVPSPLDLLRASACF
jgi:hypothetical protein